MSKSYCIKQIEVRVILDSGSFGGKGTEKVINGLPTTVSITKTGGKDKNEAKISIGGMKYSDMDQMTTLAFAPLKTAKNLVTVLAGDSSSGLSQIFSGEITSAVADFNKSPDVVFEIEALSGFYPSLIPAGPQTISGDTPVADIISQQASLMGYSFENQGVTERLRNTILNGSPLHKARSAAEHVGATLLVDDNKLILIPAESARKGNAVKLSASSGMLGYPKLTSDGITVSSLFNPAYQLDGLISVESIVPKASGTWRVTKITHNISANDSGSTKWQTDIDAVYPDASSSSKSSTKSSKK